MRHVSRLLKGSSHSGGIGSTFIELMGASGLILALTSDRTWLAALVAAVSAVLAFATRLNPFWMLLAGGCLGLAGVVWRKSVGRSSERHNALQTEWGNKPCAGERDR